MKKKIISLTLCFVFLAFMAMGCSVHTSKSFTFDVSTGDKIEIKLDTTDGYDLSSDLPFAVSLKGEVQSQGTFIVGDYFDDYVNAGKTDPKAVMIKEGEKDGNKYAFWCFDEREYNFAIKVGSSDTAILLGNIVSQESAEKVFNLLTFSEK